MVPDVNGIPYIVSLTGTDSIQHLLEQSDTVTNTLEKISGIASVFRFSNIKENFYIDLDVRYQTPDVINQLKSLRVSFPIGEATMDAKRTSVAGSASIERLDELRDTNIIIREGTAVRSVRLSDIARLYSAVDYGNSIHRTGIRSENGTLDV